MEKGRFRCENALFYEKMYFSWKKSSKYLEGIEKSYTFALAFEKEVSSLKKLVW